VRFALPWAVLCTLTVPGCTADNPDFHPADGGTDSGSGGFAPSHLTADWFARGQAPVSVSQSIDTDALTLDGRTAPAGVTFAVKDGLAVLAVSRFDVPALAVVRVRGSNPLVVVSATTIELRGALDGSARGNEPGPGGSPPDTGPGAGSRGLGSPLNSGGSGAGYGDHGGRAGSVSGNCASPGTGQNPGAIPYGEPLLGYLAGGSGGGTGSIGMAGCPINTDCRGGGGGGALQLSAAVSIVVDGAINAGGGGGKGGCKNPAQIESGSGGGGGSGGSILLEAPALEVSGAVAANGGGGGGGAFYTAGGIGGDGLAGAAAALGGTGGQDAPFGGAEVVAERGGPGGTAGPGGDSRDVTNCGNSGGGGGAAGRVHLRLRGAIAGAGVMSPLPTVESL